MGQRPGADGQTIVDQGTYSELLARGHDLSTLVESQRKSAQDAVDTAAEVKAANSRAAASTAAAAAAAATSNNTTTAISTDGSKSAGSAVPPVRPGLSADRAAASSTVTASSRTGTSPVSKARTLGQGGAEYGAVSDSYVVQPSSGSGATINSSGTGSSGSSSASSSASSYSDEHQRQLYEPDDCPPLEIAEKWRNVLDSAQNLPQKLPQTEHDHLPITPQCAVPMSEVRATA
jgi:hypothetical protein